MFEKILIANRGEIAIRIIKACQDMGIATVAVYSDADQHALHVQMADEAVHIGPASPALSYLCMDKILNVAKDFNCNAVHPGYGFMAENAEFAKACEANGICFIGPSVTAIEQMGNKLASRKIAIAHGVPVIPGGKGRIDSKDELVAEAERIGFPILIKAAAGGGGKGMRVVECVEDLESGLEMAMSESKKSFGDDTCFIEKYFAQSRHIEFQILGDKHGNIVHLFERECSIQRRHQKIVEESPSPALSDDLRARMGKAAVDLAKAVDYYNAGTVEFLLDDAGEFYLLEMNTRIQVEHPVTEMVTGVDLLKWQIRVANGEKLDFTQDDLTQQGHAIECRIYAESAERNFFPTPGKIHYMHTPEGPGIRNDCGVYSGFEVTVDYDPMLSKLICWDQTRDACCLRMRRALDDYVVLGIETTVDFLKDVIDHEAFAQADTKTSFIGNYFSAWQAPAADHLLDEAMLASTLYTSMQKQTGTQVGEQSCSEPWQEIGTWQLGGIR